MGCGRVNEGSMEEMWNSVNQFRTLSPVTYVYCGREYTEANSLCASVEPGTAPCNSVPPSFGQRAGRNDVPFDHWR
jgi:hydroxyacylglutathione hydrolase